MKRSSEQDRDVRAAVTSELSRCGAAAPTFCGVEHGSRLSSSRLPVHAVRQRADKVLFAALHDLLAHLVEVLGVVDPTVELGVGVRELCGETRG